MSLHGVMLALRLFAVRRVLRMCDDVVLAAPFGLILIRLTSFVNREL